MEQLDDMEVVKPKKVDSLIEEQKRNALPCLMFISEKNDGSIKGPCVVDGKKQEMDKDDVSVPTISTDVLFITLVIDGSEGRCVVTWDIPRALTTGIVVSRNFWLNVFPRKGGISQKYGSRAVLLGTVIDYNRHCQLEIGQYVEIHEKTDNTLKQRTEPALFLYPSGNAQGGGFL